MIELEELLSSAIFKGVFGIAGVVLAFIGYFLFKVFVLPLYGMYRYKKQGAKVYFYPMAGMFHRHLRDSIEHGDFYKVNRRKARDDPDRMFCTNIAEKPYIFLHDTVLIKEFFMKANNHYVKEPLLLDLFVYLLGEGLAIVEGDEWKAQKKMMSQSFHFEFLNSVLPTIQKLSHQRLVDMQKESLKEVDYMQIMQIISGEIVGKLFFGEELMDYKFEGKPLSIALTDLIVDCFSAQAFEERFILGKFLKYVPKHKKMIDRISAFRRTCTEFVEERRKNTEKNKGKNDMVQVLLEYEGEGGRKVSSSNIVDQFVSFFLPGLDTSGQLLTMAIYYMSKYPHYKEKIYEEVTRMYTPGKTITIEELNKFEFLTAFLKEVIRTTTPVGDLFARVATKDHMIGDVSVKKGDVVNVDFRYNHFNPKYFPDPDTFLPERWFEKGVVKDPFSYIPFSTGPRNCIGQHLAMNQIKIILCEFLTLYDFEVKPGYELKMTVIFVYSPIEPIPLNITIRKK